MKKLLVLSSFMFFATMPSVAQPLIDVVVQTVSGDYEVSIRETCGFYTIDDYGLTFFVNGMFNNDTLTVKTRSVSKSDDFPQYKFDDSSTMCFVKDCNSNRGVAIIDVNPENSPYNSIRILFFDRECSKYRIVRD